ncbi:type II toxin-antitoxin system HicB family antitoxin [uncultured Thiocystis sp.]|uniref:type II toxin-antitoxin system HicB family antitoxin n=1 Tax=uncultured Thiocystis sp. TaxID=1202134 RepID=UPI0025DBB468|nr:type II toxin-antitoxin system HicB family antitoxin [uncultured Thiocystis sp.]
MLYPVYVHLGDEQHAHGVTIPDFPGCFSEADDWDGLPAAIQEAAEVYFEGETLEPPPPTPLELLAGDPRYRDGAWLLAEIDLSRLRPKAVRLNISLPESLARRIDAHAKSHHMSRSAFLAQAASEAMRRAEWRIAGTKKPEAAGFDCMVRFTLAGMGMPIRVRCWPLGAGGLDRAPPLDNSGLD